jgi:cystathionine beta-lyase
MDFRTPPCVSEALVQRSKHGIFGYSEAGVPYIAALKSWFDRRHGWLIESDWLIKTPGVVTAIHIALLALTEPGDSVIIQQPVYHPFASAIQQAGRRLVVNELVNENNLYRIDFDDFEKKIAGQKVKMFILCNPHNPVGRVWGREELILLGDICLKHNVIVIADEIHQDFVFEGHKHLVFAGLNPRYEDITVTCTAPSKTFNLAGLPLSNIFIVNPHLHKKYKQACARLGLNHVGVMGLVACLAAYRDGEEWLAELLSYLAANMAFIREFLEQRLPEIKLAPPEGTYLAWLDFRSLGLDPLELDTMLRRKARIWLNRGDMFGVGGAGFARLNAACPRSVLEEALTRLERAVCRDV